jgi:hypothetical protein
MGRLGDPVPHWAGNAFRHQPFARKSWKSSAFQPASMAAEYALIVV